jgi:hypothetical protein
VAVIDAGSGSLSFDSGESGKFSYRIGTAPPSTARTFSSSISGFHFAPATPLPAPRLGELWWGGKDQSGWGISIAEDGGNLFLAWYTYDENGDATWFSMPEGSWTGRNGEWSGPIYRNTGSFGIGSPYDATSYRAEKVGNFWLRYDDFYMRTTFEYSLDGHHGFLNLQRFFGY